MDEQWTKSYRRFTVSRKGKGVGYIIFSLWLVAINYTMQYQLEAHITAFHLPTVYWQLVCYVRLNCQP
jgi:hypothetical protein